MPQTKKRICLLGSTGSVGQTVLRVVDDHPDRFEVVGLSAHRSRPDLVAQIEKYSPVAACLSGEGQEGPVAGGVLGINGPEGLEQLIEASEPDLVVHAVVGAAGLRPTLKALDLGVPVALANKETLVTAGELVMDRAREAGVPILPIDSEHNAIFQCLGGRESDEVRKLILTASGGPFRGKTSAEFYGATVEEALRHPTWSMGKKISIDSATMMNKGLELIEGRHLFGVEADQIQILVHPQSTVHSMVEFTDGSMLAQLGVTDMYFPIVHTLSYPERLENHRFESLDLAVIGRLEFEDYDRDAFPCPGYAYEAIRRGQTYPSVLNAANEVAVEYFLDRAIAFGEIAEIVDEVLQGHDPQTAKDLESIEAADRWGREAARLAGTKRAEKKTSSIA